jgi:hypothetical protein
MASDNRPILTIDDPDQRLRQVKQMTGRIHDGFVHLGLEYANKITGKLLSQQSNQYSELRDALSFRLEAMIFHLSLLISVQRSHLEQLNKKPFDRDLSFRVLYGGTAQQIQLFDSIVFHAISVFDYLGNLIDYVAAGKTQMRLKWPGAVKSVNDKINPLSRSPIAPVVQALHRSLVDRLYEHRSDLIHYTSDSGPAQTTTDAMHGTATFDVFSPAKITRRFHDLDDLARDKRITLIYVAFWVCERTIDGVQQFIEPLIKHMEINRKTPPGFAVYLFGDPRSGQTNDHKAPPDPASEGGKPTNA